MTNEFSALARRAGELRAESAELADSLADLVKENPAMEEAEKKAVVRSAKAVFRAESALARVRTIMSIREIS